MTETLTFDSGGIRCVATLYRPMGVAEPVPCLVMGHGFTGTQDQLTPSAESFATAGLAVLTFDYRYFGKSGGQPRQVINTKKQLEDWRAAISLARSLDGVDAQRVSLWGSSLSGGHVVKLAAEDPAIAAVVAQTPAFDKSIRRISREIKAKKEREGISLASQILDYLRPLAAGTYDTFRGLLGLSPHYIAVFAKPGEAAAFTDPESYKHLEDATKTGPTWRNEFAPRFLFGMPKYLQGTAERVHAPLLICVAELDTEADPELAMDIALKAPQGELKTYAGRHFDVYSGPMFQAILRDQVAFLRNTVCAPTSPS